MADDIAALGFDVDSGPLERGAAALDKVAASADKTQRASDALAASIKRTTDAQKQIGSGPSQSFFPADANQHVAAFSAEMERLRSKYNPLYAAGREYKSTLEEINRAARMGALSEGERASAITDTKVAFTQQVNAIRGADEAYRALGNTSRGAAAGAQQFTTQTGLARHELINLSRQAQDVFVSLQGGQSPFLVLTQQGSQIMDVFASSRGSMSGFFKQGIEWAGRFFTASRLAMGGVAAIGAAGVLAAQQWGAGQHEIEVSMLGVGRASGATVSSINRIASTSSSLFGLSRTEAREFATTLAATGRISVDTIGEIAKVGKDVATIYGGDASDAAKLLAKSFADPVRGADELNQRLGFLSAGMQRNIANLVAQNRIYDAQQMLLDGVKSGLDGVNQTLTTSSKFWTALGNIASNTWDWIGEKAAKVTGIGYVQGLNEKLETQRKLVDDMRAGAAAFPDGINAKGLKKEEEQLGKLETAWRRYTDSVTAAQDRQASFPVSAAINRALPELDQKQTLQNDYQLLAFQKAAVDRFAAVTGKAREQSPVLQETGRSYKQLSEAVQEAGDKYQAFQTQQEKAIKSLDVQIKYAGQNSPAAKARQAYDAEIAQQGDTEKGRAIASRQSDLVRKQMGADLSLQARERLLTQEQSTRAAQLELNLVGKGTAEQEAQRAKIAARNQLESDALRLYGNKDAYDHKHLAALDQEIEKQRLLRQQTLERQASNDNQFDRSQIGRDTDEQAVASKMRTVYGDDYQSYMNGAIATEMRFNQQLQFTHDLGGSALKTFVNDLQQGKTKAEALKDALSNALTTVSNKLIDMAYNNLWSAAFGGGKTGGVGLLGSLFSSSSAVSAGTAGGTTLAGYGALYHSGYGPGDAVQQTRRIAIPLAGNDNDPRYHSGIGPDEQRAVIHRTEGVFTAGQMRAMGLMANGGGGGSQTVNHYHINAPGASAEAVATLGTEVERLKRQDETMPERLKAVRQKRPAMR